MKMANQKERLVETLTSSTNPEAKLRACKELWSLGPDKATTALEPMLRSSEVETVEAAAYAIARSPSPAADLAIVRALARTPEQSLVPLVALAGERRLSSAVPALAAFAKGSQRPLAEAALQALGKIATPEAVQALRALEAEHAMLQAAQELVSRGHQKEGTTLLAHLASQASAKPVQRGAEALLKGAARDSEGFQPLYNGINFDDFIVDTAAVWSIRNGVIIGKSAGLPYNEFLRTRKHYGNFVLKAKLRLINGYGNSGIQFRSKPVPNSHEVEGYQADAGERYWGALYDESRRRKVLAGPDAAFLEKLDPAAWHQYVITARGNRIGINLDGVQTVDYEENEPGIEQTGFIALQVHSSKAPIEVWFRDLMIRTE
jgi:hypothetical protein